MTASRRGRPNRAQIAGRSGHLHFCADEAFPGATLQQIHTRKHNKQNASYVLNATMNRYFDLFYYNIRGF